MFLAADPAVCEAQSAVPLTTTTYKVQIEWWFWRSGGSYWETIFTTENRDDAESMFELFDEALQDGTVCDVLGRAENFNWIVRDVRLVTETKFNYDFRQIKQFRSRPDTTNWFPLPDKRFPLPDKRR